MRESERERWDVDEDVEESAALCVWERIRVWRCVCVRERETWDLEEDAEGNGALCV